MSTKSIYKHLPVEVAVSRKRGGRERREGGELPSIGLPLNWTLCSSLKLASCSREEKLISRDTALHFRIFLGTRAEGERREDEGKGRREGKRREKGGEKEIEQRGWVQEVQMGRRGRSKENENKELQVCKVSRKHFTNLHVLFLVMH